MWGKDAPELVRPLTTHHAARRYRARGEYLRRIVYPHEVVDGRRRAVKLERYPKTKAFLENHRAELERRKYVLDAGRRWYEIWVPADPDAWSRPKLVFRDIAEQSMFWLDFDGTVVNGDCYWMLAENSEHSELLWLTAAVGNSRFIERFYDTRFHNKLYSGRRRFMTQYVEEFPLPDPSSAESRRLVELAKQAHDEAGRARVGSDPMEIEDLISVAFGIGPSSR
jgi:hypothetical protein